MTSSTALLLLAVASSLLLLFQSPRRLFPIIALVISSFQALQAFKVMHVQVSAVPLPLICAIGLLVASVFCWAQASAKTAVSAATLLAMVALLQLLHALHVFH